MKKLGFADEWCKWVMECVSTVSYSVLINGSPTKRIFPQRGIRQGDPMSPYLYLICTEVLSSLLTNAMQKRKIHGFKASRGGPSISHMFFADDSLLFCRALGKNVRRYCTFWKLMQNFQVNKLISLNLLCNLVRMFQMIFRIILPNSLIFPH